MKEVQNGIAKAHIVTFGCQMNEADSEKMAGMLTSEGYILTDLPEEADVIVVNTCSIRAKAEQKVFSLAGRLRMLKENRPDLRIVLAGCVAQKWGDKVLERAPGLDVVVGPGRMSLLPELLRTAREKGVAAVDVADDYAEEHPAEPVRGSRLKAWINIMNGCDNYCAYCVVPYVRGRERSRSPGTIVTEVSRLAADGYREVTLLGQNVNSYGKGLEREVSFSGLLRELDRKSGIPRVRFTTSHPKDFSMELIRTIKGCATVCEAVHLPLQAGGDAVLKAMNRQYTLDDYRRMYGMLKEHIPGIALTTDIIVGFPGETAKEFAATMAALEEFRFDGIFSFRYSPREGTAAWEIVETVIEEEKKRRLQEVQGLQKEITISKNRQLVGAVEEVLVEGPSRKNPEKLVGRTRGNKILHFSGPEEWQGRFMKVKIRKAGFVALEGDPVQERNGMGE